MFIIHLYYSKTITQMWCNGSDCHGWRLMKHLYALQTRNPVFWTECKCYDRYDYTVVPACTQGCSNVGCGVLESHVSSRSLPAWIQNHLGALAIAGSSTNKWCSSAAILLDLACKTEYPAPSFRSPNHTTKMIWAVKNMCEDRDLPHHLDLDICIFTFSWILMHFLMVARLLLVWTWTRTLHGFVRLWQVVTSRRGLRGPMARSFWFPGGASIDSHRLFVDPMVVGYGDWSSQYLIRMYH